MDRLPVEVAEKIFQYIHFLDNPKKLYQLRCVSQAWKFQIDQYTSRTFKIYYNICKNEIPEEYFHKIIKTRHPLLADPQRKFYWKDAEFSHVVKDAYRIWRFLITLFDSYSENPSSAPLSTDHKIIRFIKRQRGLNDDDHFIVGRKGLNSMLFCRWNNLNKPRLKYGIIEWKIDTTFSGVFELDLSHDFQKMTVCLTSCMMTDIELRRNDEEMGVHIINCNCKVTNPFQN